MHATCKQIAVERGQGQDCVYIFFGLYFMVLCFPVAVTIYETPARGVGGVRMVRIARAG